ncbi:MAG: vancomycin high temperature exclusion protein [candidate division WS6 bacterium OLB20]|uniref:Vancomycin high temperature exclusion protein n=1 Tax=candidate division WS6 bacterium OLB20 TaxID=1617426 RepID=A0A136LVP5_9BACT|nr:MAG: vancomycin high temperature exclusion protein [candidate division WS6 bacterium OLB20]
MRRILTGVIIGLLIILAVPFSIRLYVVNTYVPLMFDPADAIPGHRVAIVFGAGLSDYGQQPSAVLEDRIMTAVDLYKQGTVQKIIMSGDNRFDDYNEPQVMIDFAREQGVRQSDLQADFAGRRTYDTCYRAKAIFGVHEAILITQEFHLPRALYTCNALGVKSIGVVADRRLYEGIELFQLRDTLALTKSFIDLYVSPPDVVLGDKIRI